MPPHPATVRASMGRNPPVQRSVSKLDRAKLGRGAAFAGRVVQPMELLSSFFGKESSSALVEPGICIVMAVNSEGGFAVECTQNSDHQVISVGKGVKENGYYLPWKNGDVTQAILDLDGLDYFFTAALSGCSIWCKYLDKGILAVRHEARTTKEAHDLHLKDGFKLVFDSSDYMKDWENDRVLKVILSDVNPKRIATLFNVYGIVTKGSGMTFVIQEQISTTSLSTKTNTFGLVREMRVDA